MHAPCRSLLLAPLVLGLGGLGAQTTSGPLTPPHEVRESGVDLGDSIVSLWWESDSPFLQLSCSACRGPS